MRDGTCIVSDPDLRRECLLPSRVASEMLGAVRSLRVSWSKRRSQPPRRPLWRLLLVVVGLSVGLATTSSCVEAPADTGVTTSALDVCALSPDGSLCDDRQPCTTDDVCLNKKCVGTPAMDGRPCTDANVCTAGDMCLAGICVGTVVADGTPCTDDDPCTDPDLCQQGICQAGGPLVCDDGDVCTVDSCLAGTGCVFSPRECAAPVDAAADMSIDAQPDSLPSDGLADLAPSAGDGPDGPVLDAEPSDTPSDAPSGPDAPDTLDAADAPRADAAVEAGAGGDGGADAAVPARDAAIDLMETPPDLRARGGGCQCAAAGAPRPGLSIVSALAGLAAIIVMRRRRARRQEIFGSARRR
jgi:MYXO-CTERM domain-containing protein